MKFFQDPPQSPTNVSSLQEVRSWFEHFLSLAGATPYRESVRILRKCLLMARDVSVSSELLLSMEQDAAYRLFMKAVIDNQKFDECTSRYNEALTAGFRSVSHAFTVHSTYVQLCAHCGHAEKARAVLTSFLEELSKKPQKGQDIQEALVDVTALQSRFEQGELPSF